MNIIRLRLNKGTYLGGIRSLLIPENSVESQRWRPSFAPSVKWTGADDGFQRSAVGLFFLCCPVQQCTTDSRSSSTHILWSFLKESDSGDEAWYHEEREKVKNLRGKGACGSSSDASSVLRCWLCLSTKTSQQQNFLLLLMPKSCLFLRTWARAGVRCGFLPWSMLLPTLSISQNTQAFLSAFISLLDFEVPWEFPRATEAMFDVWSSGPTRKPERKAYETLQDLNLG